MKSYIQALKILKKSKIILNNEKIKSSNSLNRVCAENVYSNSNYPAANNSAFDGYVINFNDFKKIDIKKKGFFKVLGTIAAGNRPKYKKIKKFEVFEIMTGGLIPKGFNAVVPKENVVISSKIKNIKYVLINQKVARNENIRFKGSDYKKNDLIIEKGTIIESNHILALKILGIKYIKVKKIPKILFFSSGNEITNQQIIPDWKVRNSNNHYIQSLKDNFLFDFKNGGILRDNDKLKFERKIKKILNTNIDIIVTSGAVSVGKFDFIPNVIKKFKLSNYFKGVAIRPGKPILFAKIRGKQKVIFGLPGNPISSAACFRFFIYPYLQNLLGVQKEKPIKAILKNDFTKKKLFTRFVKSKINTTKNGKIEVVILKGQESFRIQSFIKSNIWTLLPSGKSKFKRGEIVDCFFPHQPNKTF